MTKTKEGIRKEVVLGEKVTVQLNNGTLKIKGPKGEVERNFTHPIVALSIEDGKIVLVAKKSTKTQKMILHTFASHIKNMVDGVKEPYVYKMKVCSGHFPITVSMSGNEFIIKNFFGETVPRKTTLPKAAEVKISGADITITSPDLEAAGLAASKIETAFRITKRDIRIFQDGGYITQKPERR